MDLNERKLFILKAIVDDYILTASPVGSRTIARNTDLGLSSATIRNEMSDLEDMGYLEQPHTSAGRIPSDKAYRLYVNSIMQRAKLTEDERRYITSHYTRKLDEVDEIVKQTAYVLSSVTKYTSMVLSPRLHAARLKYLHIVPMSDDRALVLIVTDAGLTRDSMIRIPSGMEHSQIERLSEILNNRFAGRRLDEIAPEVVGEINRETAEHRSFLDAVMASMKKSLGEGASHVELSGTANIFNYPEYGDMERARALMSVIERKDLLYKMLTGAGDVEFTITIGGENTDESMRDLSVVTARYKVGDEPIGSFGVIGPTRMDYPRVMAVMGQIGRSLSELLTNMFEEESRKIGEVQGSERR